MTRRETQTIEAGEPFRIRELIDYPVVNRYLEHTNPHLLIHSSGGDALATLALYRAAETRGGRAHIDGYALMGSAILISLDDVSINPSGCLSFGEFACWSTGSAEEVARQAVALEELDALFASIIASKSDQVTPLDVRRWMSDGRRMGPAEALNLGLVNRIAEGRDGKLTGAGGSHRRPTRDDGTSHG